MWNTKEWEICEMDQKVKDEKVDLDANVVNVIPK